MFISFGSRNRNAVLQALFNLPGFSDFFEKRNILNESQRLSNQVSLLFKNLKNSYFERHSSQSRDYHMESYGNPSGFKAVFGRFFPEFNNDKQQDAYDFLTSLLDQLGKEQNQVKIQPPYMQMFYDKTKSQKLNVIFPCSDSIFNNYNCCMREEP